MAKTSGFRKMLAILLSVLLAAQTLSLSVFAEGFFILLSTTTEYLNTGDLWYYSSGLAKETGTNIYRTGSTFYISDDDSTIQIEYTLDGEPTTELHTRSEDALYFEYLRVMPAFGAALPTSPDGLEDGEYWFDLDAFAGALIANGQTENASLYQSASYYLTVDNSILRGVFGTGESAFNIDVLLEEKSKSGMGSYLRQVGVDPFAGFALLPTSEDGLSHGAYWFDLGYFLYLIGEDNAPQYRDAQYYINEDGDTMRVVSGGMQQDLAREDAPEFFFCLRRAGIDPNAGFTPLPTSDDGLQDGDYWYDIAALETLTADDGILRAQYYLSEDGATLRMRSYKYQIDFTRDTDEGALFFSYLRRVGVDPNAGFTLLPTSEDGLEDGAYWYDAAGLAAADNENDFLTASYYLSDDGTTLRVISASLQYDFTPDSDEGAFIFRFLRQAGVEPNDGFVLLPKSEDGLQTGDWWYDAAGFAAMAGDSSYLYNVDYYISADSMTLRLLYDYGASFEIARGSADGYTYFQFLKQVDGGANAGFTQLPTSEDGLEDGAYWFDAANLAAFKGSSDPLQATYYVNDNGTLLRIVSGGQTQEIAATSAGNAYYFVYLRQAGVDPNAGFTLLPTSDAGLDYGDLWYDAEGLAAAKADDALLTAQYYLSDDGTTLRICRFGMPYDHVIGDAASETYTAFLYQLVDPNAGFTALPTSGDGLEDGAYWYDAASLAVVTDSAEPLQTTFYLSDDGTTLRTVFEDTTADYARDDSENALLLAFLHQVGVDPNADYSLLPVSPDGLEKGAFWFDAAGLAAAKNDTLYVRTQYYISADGNTLRICYAGAVIAESTVGEAQADEVFPFLHWVGEDDPEPAVLTLSATTEPVRMDETFDVTVDLTYNPGLAGMSLSLVYDADVLTLKKVQTAGMLQTGNLTLGGSMSAQPYNILWDDGALHGNHTETGTILTLTFIVRDGAPSGETAITLAYDEDSTFDVDLRNIPLTVSGTTLAVIGRMPGDVDGDEDLDLQDVVTLNRYLAGGWNAAIRACNSDVNGDGSIDLKDVILIRRFLAGGWGVTLV